MKIGITERGDAALDFSWYDKIKNGTVDGAVLITKNLSRQFIDKVIELHETGHKIIVHATCTGWGQSVLEPNVPHYWDQLDNLRLLIDFGFPKENCVLRIDPIIPSDKGLMRLNDVLERALHLQLINETNPIRIRVSVMDEYKHVKERLINAGYATFYSGNNFQASPKQMESVIKIIECFVDRYRLYDLKFHTCAESRLFSKMGIFCVSGCISTTDLEIMGFDTNSIDAKENPQNRKGCHCLSCKTELLDCRHQCAHKCMYCYWKN